MKILLQMTYFGMACIALVVVTAGQAQATIIDFDSLSNGTVVGSSFAGVTFVDAEVTTTGGTLPGATAPNTIKHTTANFNTVPGDPIEAIFDFSASSVSVTGIDIGSDGFQLLAYNSIGVLIDSDSVIGVGAGVGDFFTLAVAGAIKRVEFSQVSDAAGTDDGSVYDNFTFEVIPEPSTITLASLGLLGIGYRRRKHA